MRGVIIATVLLTGCGGPSLSDNQRSEVQSIAEDFADASTDYVDTSEIESRLDNLEDGNRRAIEADKVELDSLQRQNDEIKDLQAKLDGLIEHYNSHLNKYHGAPLN